MCCNLRSFIFILEATLKINARECPLATLTISKNARRVTLTVTGSVNVLRTAIACIYRSISVYNIFGTVWSLVTHFIKQWSPAKSVKRLRKAAVRCYSNWNTDLWCRRNSREFLEMVHREEQLPTVGRATKCQSWSTPRQSDLHHHFMLGRNSNFQWGLSN